MKLRAIIKGVEYKSTLRELAKCSIRHECQSETQDPLDCKRLIRYNSDKTPWICEVGGYNTFSAKDIIKWIAEGNEPDAFTGQVIKSVEVFQNDVIEFNFGTKRITGVVVWDEKYSRFHVKTDNSIWTFEKLLYLEHNGMKIDREAKVIGNIHVEVEVFKKKFNYD